MKRKRIVLGPRPTEAGADRAKQTVSVHGLAGSSFELEVSSGETGWDVAKRIAARVGHTAAVLVLTSGGCVVDQRRLLLHQVQRRDITYVVQKLGAGRAALSWSRLFAGRTLSDTDVAALNETASLTWVKHGEKLKCSQKLKLGILPSGLQSLTFGAIFNQSLEGI